MLNTHDHCTICIVLNSPHDDSLTSPFWAFQFSSVVPSQSRMWVVFILVAVLVLLGILFMRRTYGTLEKVGIPVIKPSLFLGSEPFMKHKVNFLEYDRENFRKYGRVWGTYDMCEPWVHVADTKLIKAITVKSFEHFTAHWGVGINDNKFTTLDQADGQTWKDLRRGLTPTFSSGKIKGMLALIGSSVDNMVDHLEQVTEDNPVVDVKKVFQSMALDVIAKCAFGIESNSFKNPNNDVFVHGKKVIDDFTMSNLLGSIFMNLFQVHEKVGTLVDLMPPSMDVLWKITKSVQKQREDTGAGPGDFIDILNELNRRVEKGEFPALTSDHVTGQVRSWAARQFFDAAAALALALSVRHGVMGGFWDCIHSIQLRRYCVSVSIDLFIFQIYCIL